MSAQSGFERVLSAVLTSCVVVVAAVLVEARINPPTLADASQRSRVEYVEDWTGLTKGVEVVLGDSNGVSVTVFTDFECLFCARMDSSLQALAQKGPARIRRAIVHYPLPNHSQARPAALAFECASIQGRAAQMHNILYRSQRDLGRTSWSDLASEAGVKDIAAFSDCLSTSSASQRIEAGIALGDRLAIRGTPAVVVNGWIVEPAVPANIEAAIDAVFAGKNPKP